MRLIADLHLHSKYSRATSEKMTIDYLSKAAKVKGVNLLGTGDFTHPKHLEELKAKLSRTQEGFYEYNGMLFSLTSEISLMYSQGGKQRKVHVLLIAPDFETVDQLNEGFDKWGRRDYDGRPIFGRTLLELMDLVLETSKDVEVIPAHCFLPSERVVCNFGSKKICDLSKGDKVLTHKGIFRKVTGVFSRNYSGIVYEIIPWYMREGVTCTPEHPFYAIKSIKRCSWTKGTCRPICSQVDFCKRKYFEDYSPEWVLAKDLEVGDVLLYPRFTKVKDVKYVFVGNNYSKKGKFGKVKADKDFWRFIGYYLAEGYSNKRDGIGFAFNENEQEYADDVKDIAYELFRLKPKEVHKDKGNIEFIFYSKDLMHFIEGFCYSSKEKNAFTKSLPEFTLYLPFEKQAEILRGWWRGDAGYTVSPFIKEQMKQICFRLGIIPSIAVDSVEEYNKRGEHFIKGRKIKANHDLYVFSNLSFFEDKFNLLSDKAFKKFKTKRRTRHGWIDEFYVYLPIRKINKKKYKGKVFNLEVEKDHSYVVNVGAVHNCWTPWFGIFGSKSGFDSLEEAFQEKTKYVHAIETGLSSDPAMNWRISALDNITLVSFSDAHSPYPWRLGREATIFDVKSYEEMIKAIRTRKGLEMTIEVDPAYGKYHYDGHRACGVVLSPKEAEKLGGICPVCGKPLTIGVEHRVEELADRPEGFVPENAVPFKKLLPLHEIISHLMNSNIASKKVMNEAEKLITAFGSELTVLLKASFEELRKHTKEKIAKAIIMNREGKIKIRPGYDGVYGEPIFEGLNNADDDPAQKKIFHF